MNTILIAEDEAPIANLIRTVLTDAGYRCVWASDGAQAADLLEKEPFDLALLDIMLPGVNGYELLEYCRELEVPAIFLTAKAEAMEREGVAADFAVSLPRDLPVADMDLCALLGNALDNAIEGSRGAGERRITIRCKADKGLFMLRVENTLGGAVQPDLATTKTDKSAHGFGIPGMREIAERYAGTLDAGVRDNGFELVVCLPLAGQAETL